MTISSQTSNYITFITKLQNQAYDEERDYHKYMMLSSEAKELGFPSTARVLRDIARDELRHKKSLEHRIDTLKRTVRA